MSEQPGLTPYTQTKIAKRYGWEAWVKIQEQVDRLRPYKRNDTGGMVECA